MSRSDRAILKENGNLHGILGRAMAAASPFLVRSQGTRGPYLPVPGAATEGWQLFAVTFDPAKVSAKQGAADTRDRGRSVIPAPDGP